MRSLGAKDQVDDIATKGDVGTVPVDPNEPAGTPEGHLWYDADSTGPSGAASVATKINAGSGLTGGGDLSADRTIAVDFTDPRNYAPPIGVIYVWPFASSPDANHLMIDGATYNVADYPTLAGLFGKTSGTFTLPDLRGKFVLGVSAAHALLSTGGAETVTLTTAQIPGHAHGQVMVNSAAGSSNYDYPPTGSPANSGISTGHQATQSTGGGGSHENMPPFMSMNYIIRAK
jgi:microcystin-dependent protein